MGRLPGAFLGGRDRWTDEILKGLAVRASAAGAEGTRSRQTQAREDPGGELWAHADLGADKAG